MCSFKISYFHRFSHLGLTLKASLSMLCQSHSGPPKPVWSQAGMQVLGKQAWKSSVFIGSSWFFHGDNAASGASEVQGELQSQDWTC